MLTTDLFAPRYKPGDMVLVPGYDKPRRVVYRQRLLQGWAYSVERDDGYIRSYGESQLCHAADTKEHN